MGLPVLILLAGGKSTRMGSPKGLLEFNGTFWILEQISRYIYAQNPRVYVGLGYDYEQYFNAIPWFIEALEDFYLYDGVEVRVVVNHQPQFGAFSTLQSVLDKVDLNATILVQPIDVPIPNKQSQTTIINENNSVVIPKCDSKNGHPVKLKSEFWNPLLAIDKSSEKARLDVQIKNYIASSVSFVNVSDNSVYQNINTKKNWNNYLKNSL